MWYRPFGNWADRIPPKTQTTCLASFYQGSSGPINDDPKEVQQKALPFIVLEELAKRQVSELDIGVSKLTICAGFFACRSCEYLKVPRREMKCTKQLCLRNIRFFTDGSLLSTPSANLEFAESIAVTFKMQKNEEKHETINNGRTDNPVLCPVKQWALLVNRIWSYQNNGEHISQHGLAP